MPGRSFQSKMTKSDSHKFPRAADGIAIYLGTPVVPFCPFCFGVCLLQWNIRKKGTLIVRESLRNLDIPVLLAIYDGWGVGKSVVNGSHF